MKEVELKKCISFLKTLLKLAKDKGGGDLMTEVSNLVSGLLTNRISPQMFTDKIQTVLNSKPQPHLLPFLENMLPHVQKAYYAGEFSLEGLNGPSMDLPSPQQSQQQQSPIQQHQQQQPQYQHYAQQPTSTTIVRPSIPANLNSVTNSISGNATVLASGPLAGVYVLTTTPTSIVRAVIPGSIQQQHQYQQQQSTSIPVRHQYPAVIHQLDSSAAGGVQVTTASGPAIVYASPEASTKSTVQSPSTVRSPANATNYSSIHRPQKPPAKAMNAGKGHPPPPATPEKYRDQEDDINDVAAMGGVNLAEESQKILASTAEILSTETRSCGKDEDFLFTGPLASKTRAICQKYGLQDARPEVLSLISHATQERLKDLVEKLALIAEHRTEPLRINPLYDQVTDVRSQLRFLEDVSKKDYQLREEREKEMVLKMARSRSNKLGDSEQQRMKERAKELQKAEQEEMRNRDANVAAQLALSSSRKRPAAAIPSANASSELVGNSTNASPSLLNTSTPGTGEAGIRTQVNRPRYKRVNLRDLQLLLSQERDARQSRTFIKSFYK